MNTVFPPPADNPFASRYVRPGALPFQFAPHESADDVLRRWVAAGRRGAIVGPHGSGKSTLVAGLLPRLCEDMREPRVFALHDGQRRLPPRFAVGLVAADAIVVDGYEQLDWWSRRGLTTAVRRAECGLLVTSHRSVRGAPTVFTTRPTPATVALLVERLNGAPLDPATGNDVRRLFDLHRGDVREVLFDLYDWYELRRS